MVLSESQAFQLPPNLALSAAVWHLTSAPDKPPRLPLYVVLVINILLADEADGAELGAEDGKAEVLGLPRVEVNSIVTLDEDEVGIPLALRDKVFPSMVLKTIGGFEALENNLKGVLEVIK